MNSPDADIPSAPHFIEDDVVALMAKIHAGAMTAAAAENRLSILRTSLQPRLKPAQIAASSADVQREANLLLHELSAALERTGNRPSYLPARLRQVAKGAQMDLHVAVTARLVGSVNTLLQSLDRLETALTEWDRTESEWRFEVLSVLEDLFRIPPERRGKGSLTNVAHTADVARVRAEAEAMTAKTMEHVTALAVRVAQAEELANATALENQELRQRLAEVQQEQASLSRGTASVEPSTPAALPPVTQPGDANRGKGAPVTAPDAMPVGGEEFDFLVWENLTRGNEAAISEEQKKYLDWFTGMDAPVLDAGCGRGEFLDLLRASGISAYGIDADASMVAHCQAKGLQVDQSELFAHLESLPDSSLGGLFLGQVVEHIPASQLRHLTDLAQAKLFPGGSVVMETINPTCLTTFSGAFYADPTHQKPVHPKALEYFLTASGFGPTSIIFSAPIPPDEKLQPLREEAPLDPAVKSVVLQISANFDRLNSVMYGYANYAAAARKPR